MGSMFNQGICGEDLKIFLKHIYSSVKLSIYFVFNTIKADMIRIITLFCCLGEQYGPYVSFVSTLRFGYNLKKYYDCENKDYFKNLHIVLMPTQLNVSIHLLCHTLCQQITTCITVGYWYFAERNGTELVKRRN